MTTNPSATAPLANPQLSPARIRLALLALTIGGFGIGCSEYVAMGLLPNLAQDLLPGLFASSAEQANAQAGLLVTAYAAGVVVGAPTIAAVAARFPRKVVLMTLLGAIILGTVASALLPTFGLVVLARFISALPHGAYFGISALVAGSLMGPGRRGRGVAIVLAGLTVANVVGVPFVTWVGQVSSWRLSYLIVSLMFAVALVAIWVSVPNLPGDRSATMRRELRAFREPQVWFMLGVGAIGFGGFFSAYTYVSPLITTVTGLPVAVVPFGLVTVGIGMTVGNIVGGRAADHNVKFWMIFFFGLLIAALAELWMFVSNPVGLFSGLLVLGFAAATLSPIVQSRLMDVAHDSQSLAAALNHSAMNSGNALGPIFGGLALTAGLGYVSSIWVGIVLALCGVVIALTGFAVERRARRRRAPLLPNYSADAPAEADADAPSSADSLVAR